MVSKISGIVLQAKELTEFPKFFLQANSEYVPRGPKK